VVVKMLGMRCTLKELNEDYVRLVIERIAATPVSEALGDTVSVPLGTMQPVTLANGMQRSGKRNPAA
jgi:hypothetical protein